MLNELFINNWFMIIDTDPLPYQLLHKVLALNYTTSRYFKQSFYVIKNSISFFIRNIAKKTILIQSIVHIWIEGSIRSIIIVDKSLNLIFHWKLLKIRDFSWIFSSPNNSACLSFNISCKSFIQPKMPPICTGNSITSPRMNYFMDNNVQRRVICSDNIRGDHWEHWMFYSFCNQAWWGN